jgi:hypothetical protein
MATVDASGSMTESNRDHNDHNGHSLHDGTSILSAARTLSTVSDQEALELDPDSASTFPTLVGTSHGSHKVSRWWKRHVFLAVPHVACRDHLGMQCLVVSVVSVRSWLLLIPTLLTLEM